MNQDTLKHNPSNITTPLCPACVKKMCIIALGFIFFACYTFSATWQDHIDSAIVLLNSHYPELLIEFIHSFNAPLWLSILLLTLFQSILFPVSSVLIFEVNHSFFGAIGGIFFSFSSIMIGASLNFWIARILAQGLEKLIDADTIEKITQRTQHQEIKIIALCRLLPLPCFDIASYILGMSSFSFKHYFIGSILGFMPSLLFYSYFFNPNPITEWAFWILIALGAVIGFYRIFSKSIQR